MGKGNTSKGVDLRQKAEELLKKKLSKPYLHPLEQDTQKLIHELEVHQIELKVQNEELRRAKEESDDATQKYAELYDFAPVGYFTLSKEGDILGLNLKGASILGKDRKSLINCSFGLFVSEETRSLFYRFLSKVFLGIANEFCEVTMLIEDNNFPLPVYITGYATENKKQCLVNLIDLTQIKKVEEELIESEEKFRTLFEKGSEGIFLMSSIGKIFMMNESFAQMHGYSIEEMADININSLDANETDQKIRERINRILNGETLIFEVEHIHKQGNIISFEVVSCAIKINKEKFIVSFHRDITKRKESEKALKENGEKLFQLNADKDRFISILGHDLINPFNHLLGLSDVLIQDLHKLNIGEIQDIAKSINKSALNTYSLLEDILIWARTQQGKISYSPQQLNFSYICKDILELLKQSADAKRIKINYSPKDRLNVFADEDMLKTVLRNLISNAIKFTNSGGAINIKTELDFGSVIISVSDNGVGITPENMTKLFKISEVISTKGTTEETGTGLGLLLCKEFVERHGGKIWVESEEGKGSEFKFLLPCDAELKEGDSFR